LGIRDVVTSTRRGHAATASLERPYVSVDRRQDLEPSANADPAVYGLKKVEWNVLVDLIQSEQLSKV
jgi:hypothetical protein